MDVLYGTWTQYSICEVDMITAIESLESFLTMKGWYSLF